MKSLPSRPNLNFLRREAKALKSRHRSLDHSVCETIGHFDISLHGLSAIDIFSRRFSLLDAQRVVARQYGFASWNRLKQFVERSSNQSEYFNNDLREKLLRRYRRLQTLIESTPKEGKLKLVNDFAQETATFVNPVYNRYGWPGPNIIGLDGMEACFYLVANAVIDSELQFRTSELMRDSLHRGNLYGYYYAIISDRCLALSGKNTVYGTTVGLDSDGCLGFSRDVVDPDNLDKRRAIVGYEPFEVQREKYLKEAEKKGWDTYPDPVAWRQEMNDLAVKGGYI